MLWKIQRSRHTIAAYPNEANRYAIWIQTFAIPHATRFPNDNQQSTRTIVASVWINFEESKLLTWAALCGLLMRRKAF